MKEQFQTGAALIVVLITLLLITVIGIAAIRTGLVNLNVSTANQVRNLLMQNSDTAAENFEAIPLSDLRSPKGPLGLLDIQGNQAKEYILCYRPKSQTNVLPSLSRVINNEGGIEGNASANCATNRPNDYTSNRSTVITQIHVIRPSGSKDGVCNDLKCTEIGYEASTEKVVKLPGSVAYRVFYTSLNPTLSTASSSSINACLDKRQNGSLLSNCLIDLGVPLDVQVQDYLYAQNLNSNPITLGS